MLSPPPPAPRAVPSSAMTWNAFFLLLFGGLWAAIPMLIALLFTAIGGPVWNDWILDDRGVRAQAQAIEARPTGTRVNRRTLHDIRYRFTDRAGKTWTAETSTTNPNLIRAAETNGTFDIEYDPEDPERTRIVGESASVLGTAAVLLLIPAAIGSVLFAVGLLSALRTRRLYRIGTAAQARVTDVVATPSRQNRKRVMRMSYVFDSPGGRAEGSWKLVEPQPPGSVIWVLFDPADPSRNMPAVK